MEKLTHLSLFTGIGGIDLAAEAAGFETVCQCERAAYPLAVLEKHWPETPRFTDIEKLTKEEFVEKTGFETVTLISGGFPCQPFSHAGERRGFADERYLWPEMHRVIKELRPCWVLGENVAGFVNMGLYKTVFDLEKAGYCVRTFVIPACAVGARHERKRTFIVGADTSDSRCLRHKDRGAKNRRVRDAGRGDTKTGEERIGLDAETVRRGGVPHAGRAGGRGTQPPLAGVADGIPAEMDGGLIWESEPVGVPRMIIHEKNWANRMKALGNAVVPQQVYPILKYIAEIERGDAP
jgi:DNA (cytosine-5)-methyltransferase 1